MSIDNNYPRFRKFARKTAQLIWWTVSGQLSQKVKENKLLIIDRPHFSPLYGDHALEVPFQYPYAEPKPRPTLVVICHMYYEQMMEEFKTYLLNIPFNFDFFISTDTEEKKELLLRSLRDWHKGKIEVRIAPNRGRDIAPKLISFKEVYDQYDFVLHLHSKESPYGNHLEGWRHYLLETLMGSPAIVISVFEIFLQNANVGMIAPQHFEGVRGSIGWGYNFRIVRKLAKRLKIKLDINQYLDFPSGSMFWARTKALKPLLNVKLKFEDFPEEHNQEDGTIAHAIERLYFHVCEKAGFDWVKIGRKTFLKNTHNRTIPINNALDIKSFIDRYIVRILGQDKYTGQDKTIYHAYINSGYSNQIDLNQFHQELQKLAQGQPSIIDFDESFYQTNHLDVAYMINQGAYTTGFLHFCLFGKSEGRIWSTNEIKNKFNLKPQVGQNIFAPILARPQIEQAFELSHLPKESKIWLLILFSHLQEDLFFAGYTEFFRDFQIVFPLFDRVTISVETSTFDDKIAKKFLPAIEVIHASQLLITPVKPHAIVAFNQQLFNKALQMYNDANHTVYYCQEHEAGFYPFSTEYILAEQAIAKSQHIIISTRLLHQFFEKRNLLSDNAHVFITSPKISPWTINPEKSKKLFFYYRPESFQSRNLAPVIYSAVSTFCKHYSGYEIYMIGTIATSYSYTYNENKVFVASKLPQEKYVEIITSCDMVISLIYSAHPGVVAYQAAASGIPTITNIFENRSATVLKEISSNIIPFDPVREDLFSLIEASLDLPKGVKSFNSTMYGDKNENGLDDYFKEVLKNQ